MDIAGVQAIIKAISEGIETAAANCLRANAGDVVKAVRQQLYSGRDGEGRYLAPNYDNDPYFQEPGKWFNKAKEYKEWKRKITPPEESFLLGLPARPDNVPNLFIDGTFYSEIDAVPKGDESIEINPGEGNGRDIVGKYGGQILSLSEEGVAYFNEKFMLPAIGKFFKDCGYS